MTGGLVVISIIGICIGLLFPAGRQDALITEEFKALGCVFLTIFPHTAGVRS